MKKALLMAALMMVAKLGLAQTVYIGGLRYNLDSNTWTASVARTYFTGAVVIPDKVVYNGNTYTVTSIGDYAFYPSRSGLTSVTIGDSITSIGYHAFEGCSGLTSVTIGNSVTYIGNYAFEGCSGLTSVTIPNSVTSIGSGAFSYCSGLTSVTIPNSVTSISHLAFEGCSGLTSVTIPNSVTSIGFGVFSRCTGLTSITVSSGNTIYDSRNNCNAIIETATNTLIAGCPNTIIPNSVTSIGFDAFLGHSSLTSVTIPNSVTYIGQCAFSRCTGLTSVVIPNSVTHIAYRAFEYCSGLTSVTIGNSVASIGSHAFAGCNSLDSIVMLTLVPPYGMYDWSGYIENALVYVPCGALAAYQTASYYNFSRFFVEMHGDVPNLALAVNDSLYGSAEIILQNGQAVQCSDSSAVIQATAAPHYHFDHWSNGRTANPDTLYLEGDSTVTAFFALDMYTVSAVSNNEAMGVVAGGGAYAYLDTVTLTATAFAHHHFVRWSDGETDSVRTEVVSGDLTLTAIFATDTHMVSVTLNDEAMGVVAGGGAYAYLDTVTLTATAFAHHHFVRWSDGETNSVRTEVVSGDLTLTAIFAIDTHMVSVTLNDEAMGSVVGAGAYPYSTEVSLEAVPEEGYRFVRWGDGSTDNPAVFTLTGDTTVSAIFEEVEIPSICKVSVQDDRNVVFWSREYEVEQYRIYREGAVAGDYELVATVPYSDPSVWTDEESRPGERRYSYKMTVVDAQGNESPFSEEHKTMHLTIGQGTGNQWNLAWPEYRGAELESYMIYRGTEENDLQLIGQLPAGGAMSYTDEAAPAGTVYYQVAAVMSSPCDIAGIKPLIRSNIAVGEGEDSVGVRDVQAGNLQVRNAGGHIHVSLDGHEVAEYRVYDAIGREVYHATREARTPALPGGVYLVKVAGHPAHKVVVLR